MTREELETQLVQVINDAEWDTMEQVMKLIDEYADECQSCDDQDYDARAHANRYP